MKTFECADLFCGAGGFSSGLLEAAKEMGHNVRLLAVNHWDVAIATHTANHPDVTHVCKSLDGVNPRQAVPGGRLHLLMASPECTHHSNARGGKPMSDQSRASAWHILRWCEALYVENVLIENVKEFREWGPLGANGRPLKKLKGALYREFLRSFRALGYIVEDRVLNAAHYGDATTRQRLFIQAKRGGRKISWPEPSHVQNPDRDLFGAEKWRAAREIIDWTIPGKSIYGRKRPLVDNTMRRILAGLHKYSGLPFVIGAGGPIGAGRPQSVDEPLGTVLGENHRALCEPYLVILRRNQTAQGVDEPLRTMTTSGATFGLCQPYIIGTEHFSALNDDAARSYPLERPLPTVTGKGQFRLCEPYLVKFYGGHDAAPLDEPLPTVTANYEHLGLAEPFLVEYHGSHKGTNDGERRTRSLDDPIGTLDTSNRFALAQPFLVQYNGTGGPTSVDDPLNTATSKDRFGLAIPEWLDKGDKVFMLDIRFRMLQPHELAAAMSFPPDYQFIGNRDDKVKMIGNAVPVRTGKALCKSILGVNQ